VSVSLRCAFSRYAHTADVINGNLSIPGFDLHCESPDSIVQAYREMARSAAFDVCEMAPVTFLAARAAGVPLIALPIFTFRRFHHGDVTCKTGIGIEGPADLEGRIVGVRAYSVTSAVWARAIWQHEYAVDLSKINWLTDDEENVESLPIPANVRRLPSHDSIRSAFKRGEIAASFTGIAGLGRTGPPNANWAANSHVNESPAIEDSRILINDWAAAETDWYRRTGIYPLHGVIVMREEIAQMYPELGRALFDVFNSAKQSYLSYLTDTDESERDADDRVHIRNMSIVGSDPLPYGLKANKSSIEALLRYSAEQGFSATGQDVEDLFMDVSS
jgi:4,5-dihydroxyphthalate decarboxylase